MRQQTRSSKEPAEKVVQDIRRATRKHYSAEEKIRIVLEGLRGEDSIAELCRREGIAQNLYYRWSKRLPGGWQEAPGWRYGPGRLSHTMRGLEARLGVRLLTRTTRRVAPTETGERLLHTLGPRFEEIEAELSAISELREKPAGTVRITAMEYAAEAILLPKLAKLLRDYPDIKVEIAVDYGLTDIVTQRYDAGVRSGEQVGKDMIAVRIGPDISMAVVGAPSYFRKHPEPKRPQDLIGHNCINLRLPTHGALYAWEFEKSGRELKVRVEGQLTFNTGVLMLDAALAGHGLSYVPEGLVEPHIARGRLKRVLADWCPPFSGYHLWYPSRRQSSAAFALVVEALRYRG